MRKDAANSPSEGNSPVKETSRYTLTIKEKLNQWRGLLLILTLYVFQVRKEKVWWCGIYNASNNVYVGPSGLWFVTLIGKIIFCSSWVIVLFIDYWKVKIKKYILYMRLNTWITAGTLQYVHWIRRHKNLYRKYWNQIRNGLASFTPTAAKTFSQNLKGTLISYHFLFKNYSGIYILVVYTTIFSLNKYQ